MACRVLITGVSGFVGGALGAPWGAAAAAGAQHTIN